MEKKGQKGTKHFFCEMCAFFTNHYGLYKRHLTTAKHTDFEKRTKTDEKNTENTENVHARYYDVMHPVNYVNIVSVNEKRDKKTPNFFYCNECDYSTTHYGHYIRHTNTKKHTEKKRDKKGQKNTEKHQKNTDFKKMSMPEVQSPFFYSMHNSPLLLSNTPCFSTEKMSMPEVQCQCGERFSDFSLLNTHNCAFRQKMSMPDVQSPIVPLSNNFMMELVRENKEIKQMISNLLVEQHNTINHTITSLVKHLDPVNMNTGNKIMNNNINTIHNSNNKTFNLQFFLNETCKDAMNISDFVNSIKLDLTDLEHVGTLGYVEGISNIIANNLKALDITKRPVHCTDKKREILYVKDQDKWEKDEDKKKIRNVVRKVATKNALLLPVYKATYPECSKSVSTLSDRYNKLIVEAMGGSGNNDLEKEDKIIKHISNISVIDKTNFASIDG
jgi:hypothetical protein